MNAAVAVQEPSSAVSEDVDEELAAQVALYRMKYRRGKWQLTPEREAVMREHYRPGFGGSMHCAELLAAPGFIISEWALALGLRGMPQKQRKPRRTKEQIAADAATYTPKRMGRPRKTSRIEDASDDTADAPEMVTAQTDPETPETVTPETPSDTPIAEPALSRRPDDGHPWRLDGIAHLPREQRQKARVEDETTDDRDQVAVAAPLSEADALDALITIYGRPPEAKLPPLPDDIVKRLNELVTGTINTRIHERMREVTEEARDAMMKHAVELARRVVMHEMAETVENLKTQLQREREEAGQRLHATELEVARLQQENKGLLRSAGNQQRALTLLNGRAWREATIPALASAEETPAASYASTKHRAKDAPAPASTYTLWLFDGQTPVAITQVQSGEKLLVGRARPDTSPSEDE